LQSFLLKSQLNRITVTSCDTNIDDYCEIDGVLLDAANIATFEKVHIYNSSNGSRFTAHVKRGKDNSGDITLGGATTKNGNIGDYITVASYVICDEKEVLNHTTRLCYVDESNTLTRSLSTPD
jgi:aspartate 1-decarboxylase